MKIYPSRGEKRGRRVNFKKKKKQDCKFSKYLNIK